MFVPNLIASEVNASQLVTLSIIYIDNWTTVFVECWLGNTDCSAKGYAH